MRIAAGEPLGLAQERIRLRGHAIEVRLYAEDPANGYLPSTGRVLAFDPPRAPGVRVDAGLASGDEVTVNYDPMLAKLIATAEDRPAAIQRLTWALDHFAVLGIATNLPLLRAIAGEADFQAARTTTSYLEEHNLLGAAGARSATPSEALAVAALFEALADGRKAPLDGLYNPWRAGGAVTPGAERRYQYRVEGAQHTVTLRAGERDGHFAVTVDGVGYPAGGQPVTARLHGDRLALDVGGLRRTAVVARRDADVLVSLHGRAFTLAKPRPLDVDAAARGGEAAAGAQDLVAPMAGTIVKVNVREGEMVDAQQTLLVLGAMKMEHAIAAPATGRVKRIAYAPGDVVPGGAVLIELESGAAADQQGDSGLGEAESGAMKHARGNKSPA